MNYRRNLKVENRAEDRHIHELIKITKYFADNRRMSKLYNITYKLR